jgi:hypothetical protein
MKLNPFNSHGNKNMQTCFYTNLANYIMLSSLFFSFQQSLYLFFLFFLSYNIVSTNHMVASFVFADFLQVNLQAATRWGGGGGKIAQIGGHLGG